MAGFFRRIAKSILTAKMQTNEEFFAEQERLSPGFRARVAVHAKSQQAIKDFVARSASPPSVGQTWGGSLTDVSNPAVAAHLLAAKGSLDSKVAFSIGAPGAPDGTGRLVGLNGSYRG